MELQLLPPGYSRRKVLAKGPVTAEVLIVGEAPGKDEDFKGLAFVGQSGQELERMLSEAGFIVSQCYFTNVVKYLPPDTNVKGKKVANDIFTAFYRTKGDAKKDRRIEVNGCYPTDFMLASLEELKKEIELVNPRIIVGLGNVALWALTGHKGADPRKYLPSGITDFRGSVEKSILGEPRKVICTLHPAAILRAWGDRYKLVRDLKRAKHEAQFPDFRDPGYSFIIRPSFSQAIEVLTSLAKGDKGRLVANDIETKEYQISCTGFAWSDREAICIPFFGATGTPYWSTPEEEWAIVEAVQNVLHSPAVDIVGQNYAYDAQYKFKRGFGFVRPKHDTMVAYATMFPGEDKGLDFLSSMLCEHHRYWKRDSKIWDPALTSEESHWIYNATDCVKTWEIIQKELVLLDKFKLRPQYDHLMRLWPKVVWMMLRGVKIDPNLRASANRELVAAIKEREEWIDFITDKQLNVASPDQMKWFMNEVLGFSVIKHKRTKKDTTGKEATEKWRVEKPVLIPFLNAIGEVKPLRTFLKNFGSAPLDSDGRIRCYYNIVGAETFRFTSAESAFDSGTNLENVPKGDRSKTMRMPNMRRPFVPDTGFEMCEPDLAGADAQVVAYLADDALLKQWFREKVKIHAVTAKELYGSAAGLDGKAEPYYTYAKQGRHLTNYGGKARTMAATLGLTVHECELFQRKLFGMHPGIAKWHTRTEHEINTTRSVKNPFGFRKYFFDRIEGLLPQALAWVPQSTVAHTVNLAICLIAESPRCGGIEILLQTHDSFTAQYPIARRVELLKAMQEVCSVPIPFSPQPLIIDFALAVGPNWGDLEKTEWPE